MPIETSPIITKPYHASLRAEEHAVVDAAQKKILSKGDALDNMRRVKRLRPVGPIAAIGSGVMATYMLIFYETLDTLPAKGTIVLATAAAGLASRPIVNVRERHATARVLKDQKALSSVAESPVELYRYRDKRLSKKKKALGLRWYGFSDEEAPPATLRDQLAKVAAVGQQAQVAEVILPYSTVEPYLPDGWIGTKKTQTEWLKDTKKRKLKDKKSGADEIIVLKAEDLDGIIANIEILNENQPLHTIMQILHHAAPRHPAHELYESFIKHPKEVEERLRKLFKRQIEMTLEDTDYVKETKNDITRKTSRTRAGEIRKGRRSSQPEVTFHDRQEWGNVRITDLLRHKNIRLEDVKVVLGHPERYTRTKVREYCEIAAWMTIEGYDIGLGTGEGLTKSEDSISETEKPDVTSTFQRRVVEQEFGQKVAGKRKRNRLKKSERTIKLRSSSVTRRAVRSGAILLTSATLGGLIGYAATDVIGRTLDHEDRIRDVERVKYPNGIIPLEAFEPIKEKAKDEVPLANLIYDGILTPLEYLTDKSAKITMNALQTSGITSSPEDINRYLSEATQERDCDFCPTKAGNVTKVANRPVWYIQPFNGMPTAGYWAEETLKRLQAPDMAWESSFGYVDPAVDQATDEARVLPNPLEIDRTQQLIKVERAIDFSGGADFESKTQSPLRGINAERMLIIPILEDTHLVAGSIDETLSVKEVSFPDGTSALLLPDIRGVQKMEYWLAPGDTSKVRAIEPIFSPGSEDKVVAEQTIPLWEKHLNRKLPKDPKKREQFQEEYIKSTFDYRLAPLPENRLYEKNEYIDLVLSLKQGNCNIVNNLLIVSNPEQLNGVSGYLNRNKPGATKQYLSGNEAHFYAVDREGNRHDATPSNVLAEEAKFFEENFGDVWLENPADERKQNVAWLGGFLIASILGGTGYYHRRKLFEMYHRGEKLANELNLKLISDDSIAAAYSAYCYERFSVNPFTTWDYPKTGTVPLQDDLSGAPATREELIQKFSDYAKPDTFLTAAAHAAVGRETRMYTRRQKKSLSVARRVIVGLGQIRRAETSLKRLEQEN